MNSFQNCCRSLILTLGIAAVTWFEARLVVSQTPSQSAESISSQTYEQVQIGSLSFRVRSDLKLEMVADASLIRWPIAATWDQDGNLVIAESAGVKQTVEEQQKTRPHRVVRLMDKDRDGRFDSRQVVAEDLGFPEGVMVYGKHLLVSAPPEILKLTDENGDGVYEERSVWHDGQTLTYCANDLHGPFLGPEGWVYWTKSAFAKQSFPIRYSFVSESSASHLYRKPFDSKIADRVFTGGMDNLVHVAFDDDGDRFFVSTFLHHPGNGLRDGIGHGVYGAVFGKNHAVLDGHPRTGPLMLPLVELGPAAPAGLLVTSPYSGWSAMPPPPSGFDDQRSLVVAQFNLQRVSAHSISAIGATYSSINSDLIIGDQLDFHPVTVLEDYDSSLLIVDTGGWYDLCCPSSGNEERVSPGGIYRLSLEKAPRDSTLKWQDVESLLEHQPIRALTHNNTRIRSHATMTLFPSRGKVTSELVESLTSMVLDESQSRTQRKAAFWVLAKTLSIGSLELSSVDSKPTSAFEKTPDYVKSILVNRSRDLLPSALQLTSTYAWPDQVEALIGCLSMDDATIRRLSAECLGRIGDPKGVQPLLQAWQSCYAASSRDRNLEHAILYALMELANSNSSAEECRKVLTKSVSPQLAGVANSVAAVRVLKETNNLSTDMLASLIEAAESNANDLSQLACEAIATQDRLVAGYVVYLASLPLEQQRDLHSTAILSQAYRHPAVVEWVEKALLSSVDFQDWHEALLNRILDAYRNQPLPLSWQTGLAKHLETPRPNSGDMIRRIGATRVPKEAGALISAIAQRVAADDFSTVATAISAIPRGLVTIPEAQQDQVVKVLLNANHPQRELAWRCLNRIDFGPSAWDNLLSKLTTFGPVELPGVVEALSSSQVAGDVVNVKRLLEALDQSPSTRSLSPDQLESWFKGSSDETKSLLRSRIEKWFAPSADMSARLDELVSRLEPGDARRGQDIFRSVRAACNNCHRIGYVGGTIGPELTKIGQSRTRRDFVEAIAFPNHRIAQGYTTTSILTEDDEVYSGLIANEDSTRIELILSADKRISIDKKEIVKRNQGTTSIMPAGIEKVLSVQELSDLIAFLEQSK